jgi:hypothetical protein
VDAETKKMAFKAEEMELLLMQQGLRGDEQQNTEST